MAYIQVLADLADVDRLALVHRGRVASDDRKIRVARQIGDDVLGDAIGQAGVGGVGREIVERQHGDRGGGQRRRVAACSRPPETAGGDQYRGDGGARDRPPPRPTAGCQTTRRGSAIEAHAVGSHRLVYVFDPLLAEAVETDRELVLHMIIGAAGDDDAAGIGKALQPIGDVHAVAVHVVPLGNHVAEIDADAEPEQLVRGNVGVRLG